jgi:tetratricopeptide (TPR) repeat protein
MKLSELLPPSDLLRSIEGVEGGLRQRRRIGTLGWIGFLIASSVQVIAMVINSDVWKAIIEFNPSDLIAHWPYILPLVIAVPLLLVTGWSRFWLQESKAPFRYTCSIGDFSSLEANEKIPAFTWLSHDLAEKLTRRIGRLSLLEDGSEADNEENVRDSHIHICGHYGIREKPDGSLFIEVMPRVRIGPPGKPETLAHPVTFRLRVQPGDGKQHNVIDTKTYEQLLERIYSSIATEIYRQIERDVEGKIELLPTNRFKAVALFHEAEDYARSNTLDAYDEALRLYERAIRLFDPSWQEVSTSHFRRIAQKLRIWRSSVRRNIRRITALFFSRAAQPEILCARAEIGYANMLIYRRILAGISGRRLNPVFETRRVAIRAVDRLRVLPHDIPEVGEFLFSAYITLALSWYYLGSVKRAEEFLKKATELDPPRSERDPKYLFAQAVRTTQLRSQMQLLRRAVELDHRFEVAQFELAITAESLWRTRPTLENNVADMVFREYMEVLRINPGNIGAWANLGYMHWLLGNVDDAIDMFENGREYKVIKRETFVAELDYGSARIAAEVGNFIDAYRHYADAVSAHVAQGGSHIEEDFSTYLFRAIDETILERYKVYRDRAQENYNFWLGVHKNGKNIRDLLQSLSGSRNNGNSAEILSQFLRSVPAYLTASEKQRIATIAPDLSFEKISQAIQSGNREIYEPIMKNEEIIRLVETYIPTPRMCNSVLAFVMNEFGQACHYYYLRSGNAEWLENARQAYRAAIDLNRNYVTPHFNLFRLGYRVESQDPWEKQLTSLEEIKKTLDDVIRLEPTWPNGLLAMAELEAKIAFIQLERAHELESQVESFMQKRISFQQQPDHKGIDPHDTTRATASQKPSDKIGPTDTIIQQPFLVDSPKGGIFAPDFITFEEAARQRQELNERENRVKELLDESSKNLKRALDRLRMLLPHKWIEMDPEDLAGQGLKSLLQRNDIDWVKDFDDLQVGALFTWGKIVSLYKSKEAEEHALSLFLHIRYNFLPEYFELHEEMLTLLERMLQKDSTGRSDNEKLLQWCRETLQQQIGRWFADDPGAYWVLTYIQDWYISDEQERIRMLDEAVSLPDRSAYLYVWIGNQLLINNANDKARRAFDTASNTKDPHILLDIAQGYVDIGEKNRAFQIYHQVGKSKQPEIQIELARFKLESGMFKDCREILGKIITRISEKTDRTFLMKLANIYFRIGDYKSARAVYNNIKEEPDFALELSTELMKIRAWEDSIRILETVLHRQSGEPDESARTEALYESLAEAYFRADRIGEFVERLEYDPYFAERSDKHAALFYSLGTLCKSNAQFERAIEYYSRAVYLSPDVPVYQWSLAEAASLVGDTETLLYRCQKAVDLRKANETDTYDLDFYYENLAEAYFKAGKTSEFFDSIERSDEFAKASVRKARFYNRIGNLNFQMLNYNDALAYYHRALELDPTAPIYYCNLGRTHGNIGDWQKMEESCSRAIALRIKKPDDAYGMDYYYEFLAAALYKLSRTGEILSFLERADTSGMLPGQLATIWNRLGNLHFEDRLFDQAVRCYIEAVRMDEKNPIYHCNLGRAHGENGDRHKMLEHCKRAYTLYRISKMGESTLDYYLQFLAEAYYDNEMLVDFETELEELEQSDEFIPQGWAIIYNRIGNLFFRTGDFPNAIRYYQKAIAFGPESPIYHCNLGRAAGNLGDYDRMIEFCRKAVDLRKKAKDDDYEPRYYYEYMAEAYTRNRQHDIFLEYFTGELVPELTGTQRARVLNYMGNLLTELNDGKTAADFYRKAIELDAAAPIYHCNLGLTLGDLDDTDGMLTYCGRAVVLRKNVTSDDYGEEFYFNHLIDAYLKAGRLDEIVESFNKDKSIIREPSARALIFNKIGNLYYEKGKWNQAIWNYTAAVDLDNKRPVFLCNLGRAYGENNNFVKMIEYCVRALRIRQSGLIDDYEITYYYDFVFDAFHRAKKIGDFITLFQSDFENHESEKTVGYVFNMIGNMFFSESQFERAQEYYKKSVARDPLEPVYHLNIARSYLGLAYYKEAMPFAKRALELRRKLSSYQVDESEFVTTLTQAQVLVGQE